MNFSIAEAGKQNYITNDSLKKMSFRMKLVFLCITLINTMSHLKLDSASIISMFPPNSDYNLIPVAICQSIRIFCPKEQK